ncbi:MAG: hypothetical protein ACW987_09830 [Candidatus Thorarchaeota archaeon]|jgi:hypothetical protein
MKFYENDAKEEGCSAVYGEKGKFPEFQTPSASLYTSRTKCRNAPNITLNTIGCPI